MFPAPWGPPRADERGRARRGPRSGWLVCAFGACLLVGAVAVQAQVGSVGPTAGGLRLPSGATSVTAEPNTPQPDVTVAAEQAEETTTTDLVTSTTSVPPSTVSTAPTRPGATRTTAIGAPTDPPPPVVTDEPTVPTTSAPISSPTSQLPATTATTAHRSAVTTTTVTPTTVTTVAPFDPALCASWLYLVSHWGQCRAVPPPLSTTSTTHRADD
jgi:hypothetical protein